nr:7-cyano-7-deazaguanine synthase [Bacteriovorax sp. HI3]
MNPSGKAVAILFSGGTDSTLTAAMLQENFEKVHLVTYDRFGFHATDNTAIQTQALKEKYGEERFVHTFLNVDKLFQHVSYENYFENIKKHGLFNLSTCGLCKLSMHVRTIKYCIDNEVYFVADGANQAMTMEPAQMKPVIDEMKRMYAHFGITYFNPVFEMDGPEDKDFINKSNAKLLARESDYSVASFENEKTPGFKLYKMGLAPSPNVKGSDYDKKRQPRCFQFIIFNIFALKYFMANKTYEEYTDLTTKFYSDKIKSMIKLIENRNDKKVKEMLD